MPTTSDLNLNLSLPFPNAGVVFGISVESGSSGSAPSFRLNVTDPSGKTVPFRLDASPQLADWVRGYTRWLRRAHVTASYDEGGISGTFASGLTPEQVLQGVRDACDMIRQRFALYEESVLA